MSRLEIVGSTGSTNSALAAVAASQPHGYAIMAISQTAGRGQRGNSWEAEPGMNVTLSLLIKPGNLDVRHQFSLSEAVALGVVHTLDRYGIRASVKWPNDIYVADSKICGILIENSLMGTRIDRSIVGIGLNVNQQRFMSDAPNPVSMWQLTGLTHDIGQVAETMISEIMNLTDTYLSDIGSRQELHRQYMSHMWRNNGNNYPYLDPATGNRFMASIVDVAPTGHLTLHTTSGQTLTFAFKEVQSII